MLIDPNLKPSKDQLEIPMARTNISFDNVVSTSLTPYRHTAPDFTEHIRHPDKYDCICWAVSSGIGLVVLREVDKAVYTSFLVSFPDVKIFNHEDKTVPVYQERQTEYFEQEGLMNFFTRRIAISQVPDLIRKSSAWCDVYIPKEYHYKEIFERYTLLGTITTHVLYVQNYWDQLVKGDLTLKETLENYDKIVANASECSTGIPRKEESVSKIYKNVSGTFYMEKPGYIVGYSIKEIVERLRMSEMTDEERLKILTKDLPIKGWRGYVYKVDTDKIPEHSLKEMKALFFSKTVKKLMEE